MRIYSPSSSVSKSAQRCIHEQYAYTMHGSSIRGCPASGCLERPNRTHEREAVPIRCSFPSLLRRWIPCSRRNHRVVYRKRWIPARRSPHHHTPADGGCAAKAEDSCQHWVGVCRPGHTDGFRLERSQDSVWSIPEEVCSNRWRSWWTSVRPTEYDCSCSGWCCLL